MDILRDPEGREVEYLENIGKLRGERVIEIGAGEGRMTWRYASMADSVVAIDPDSERMIEAGRSCPEELSTKVNFALAKSQSLPFRYESFDAAIFAWSL
jgi:ubiquinone/menaquinone biosynthesis C-methylase UbiE